MDIAIINLEQHMGEIQEQPLPIGDWLIV